MIEYKTAYEYEKNVNPKLKKIPIIKKNVETCITGVNYIDNSELYNINYKATSPNLLASFIVLDKINKDKTHIKKLNISKENEINASSHLFYVLSGKCTFKLKENQTIGKKRKRNLNYQDFIVNNGEIFICPAFYELIISNESDTEKTEIYYVNDSPLLNYLGAVTKNKIFRPCVYDKNFIQENLKNLSDPNNNRKGILLSNLDTEKIGVNTITPTLWSLYNELPAKTVQKPHRHNSVALDLCIFCSDSENVYTLVGDELDENGKIVNPTKVNWVQGEMFITPPGLWHSHNNEGDTDAYILPIQDAGLLLYQRILGIELH